MSRARTKTCKWCDKPLDSRKHRGITESHCFVRNEVEIRSRYRPRVKRVADAYENGRLRTVLLGTDVEEMLMKRQRRLAIDAALFSDNHYTAPRNVGYMSQQGFVVVQVTREQPFGVVVLGPERPDGTRKRMIVRRNNLWDAIRAHRQLSKKYRRVYIVSLVRAYDIPGEWRFKKDRLPKKFKWCPYCADFRIYHRVSPPGRFFALKKVEVYNDKKREYEFQWKERKIWLTSCTVCGNTNRNQIYRRSNQPWELRQLNRTRRRVKPRTGLPEHFTQKQIRKGRQK